MLHKSEPIVDTSEDTMSGLYEGRSITSHWKDCSFCCVIFTVCGIALSWWKIILFMLINTGLSQWMNLSNGQEFNSICLNSLSDPLPIIKNELHLGNLLRHLANQHRIVDFVTLPSLLQYWYFGFPQPHYAQVCKFELICN